MLQESKILTKHISCKYKCKSDGRKSNGISEESIENITKSDNTFAPTFIGFCPLAALKFNGNCLIKNNFYNFRKIINLYFLHTRYMVKKFKDRFHIK